MDELNKRRKTKRKTRPKVSSGKAVAQGQKTKAWIERISGLDRKGLLVLWEQIHTKSALDWPQGKAFEYLILRAFQLEGAEVVWPYRTLIGNVIVEEIDGFVKFDRISFMVESKDQSDAIAIGPIAKLRNQLLRRPAGLLGCVFSRSGFTPPAVLLSTYCAPQAILLWDADEIDFGLANGEMKEALEAKYSVLLERGIPDWEYEK